jgi:hypothetical protein
MYDADIQSMDAAAKGAKVGCHHKLYWFVYDIRCKWKRHEMNPGMGLIYGFTNDSQCFKTEC